MVKRLIYSLLICICVFTTSSCRPQERAIPTDRLVKIEATEKIKNINGFKAENNRFYFTGFEDNSLNLYYIDLDSKEIIKEQLGIEKFESFIHLSDRKALMVDENGELFYREGDSDRRIDSNISRKYGVNIAVSPKLNKALYTKGQEGDADLFLYIIGEEAPILIKKSINDEAFATFAYTTLWSNKGDFFIFNNREIYNSKGELYDTIDASSIRWSPDDKMISFIRMPENKQEAFVFSSHWQSYIGNEFAIYNLENKSNNTLFLYEEGLVNIFEDIKWSGDSTKTAISIGEIRKAQNNALESMKHKGIIIYDTHKEAKVDISNMPYNYNHFLFNNYIYGSNLGQREIIEIKEIGGEYRREYPNPKILNNKDMFVIHHNERGYILSDRTLISANSNNIDDTTELITFPWDVASIHLESENNLLIILNKKNELFLFELSNKGT